MRKVIVKGVLDQGYTNKIKIYGLEYETLSCFRKYFFFFQLYLVESLTYLVPRSKTHFHQLLAS